MWSEKGVDNSRSFLNMPEHAVSTTNSQSNRKWTWSVRTTCPVGAQHSFTAAFLLSPQHPHSCRCTAQLHLPSEPTTLLQYCMCCQATQHQHTLPDKPLLWLEICVQWIAEFWHYTSSIMLLQSIMVWLWRAKIYSFPIIILCHGSTRLVHHWCAPSECLILKAAVWIADLSLIKILFNSFWLQIKLGFWTISEMPPLYNCHFITCIYVKQCSQCLQL